MHQDIEKEVDQAFCASQHLPTNCRHVRGGAVYLDKNQLFTHFIYPANKAPSHAEQLYPMFIDPVVRTYRDLGIPATHRPVNDTHVDGRKIGGTGATSIGGATVLVGRFMLDFDTTTMSRCLNVPSEEILKKLRQTLENSMTTMVKQSSRISDRSDLNVRFLRPCAEALGVKTVVDQPTADEWAAIEQAQVDLADPEWIDVQHRKLVALGVKIAADTHLTEAVLKAPGGLIRVHLLDRAGRVADLVLSGDFTCLPPEGVDDLAEDLSGCARDLAPLTDRGARSLRDREIEMPGIGAGDIASAIIAALHPRT